MTFSSDVKKELTTLVVRKKENAKAELSAFFLVEKWVLEGGTLSFTIENTAVARRIFSLLNTFFDIRPEINTTKSKKVVLTLPNFYQSKIDELFFSKSKELERNKSNPTLEDQKRSFLRGVFLLKGSVSDPDKKNYHLEIFFSLNANIRLVKSLLTSLNTSLEFKQSKKRNGQILYLKKADQIVDFLSLIGVVDQMLKFEDERIMRDLSNSANRLVNAEVANEVKIQNASSEYISLIRQIDRGIGLAKLPKKLREIAELRIEFPDDSLVDLGKKVNPPISKSGVNHRLRKLKSIIF